MRHIVYYERVRGHRADQLSCFTAKIYLVSVIQTGRSGRICFFNVLVVKFECKYGNLCGSVVVVRYYIIVNDLEIIDKMYGV